MQEINEYKISPLGDSALIIRLGNEINEELNDQAITLSNKIAETGFPGLIESVPAYASVSVFYDPLRTRHLAKPGESCFFAIRRFLSDTVDGMARVKRKKRPVIRIPVDFSEPAAPDLEFLAAYSDLTKEEVIGIFTSREYRVYMIGFVPGFPYMGSVDPRIEAPRLETPRKTVPHGSVGIAGGQTGIYPMSSPGGWRLIGRTDIAIFSLEESPPALFAPGDRVRFRRA